MRISLSVGTAPWINFILAYQVYIYIYIWFKMGAHSVILFKEGYCETLLYILLCVCMFYVSKMKWQLVNLLGASKYFAAGT